MVYSVLRRPNDNHDMFYCVGINGEPMTNPTHSALAAEQARKICETYRLQGQYSINMLFKIDCERKSKAEGEKSNREKLEDPYGENT